MKLLKSLVAIAVLGTATHLPAELVRAGNGSGFFVTQDGYFVTNEHVVNGADRLKIQWGGKAIDAVVIKKDAQNDIAILKAEGTYPCLPLGGDLTIRPGEDVFTIGFPMADLLGEAPKTTIGSVTALSGLGDDVRTFQISVQIQPGNSGGPLVLKSNGNVIGVTSSTINTAMAIDQGRPVPQNVNYAMKASYIRPLLATIAGMAPKLPPENPEAKPWPQIQETVEGCVGMVIVFKEQSAVASRPAVMEETEQPDPQPTMGGVWVFADSSQRRLTVGELQSLSSEVLWRARNEIYARNGLIFSTPRGRAFSAALGDSYRGTDTNQERVSARLNSVEKANVELIRKYE